MELLEVRANYQLGTIEENLEEVEKSIRAYCDQYKGIVVREEDIPETKKLLAEIRKEKDALDTRRKDIKKAWNKPYDAFEKKVKGLIAIYDGTIDEINGQLRAYENNRIAYKDEKVRELYEEIVPADIVPYLHIDAIYNPKWLNATYSLDQVREDINQALDMVNINISSVKALKSKWEEDALNVLKSGGNLADALRKIRTMDEQEARIAEEKAKEEKPSTKPDPVEQPFFSGRRTYTMVFKANFEECNLLTGFLDNIGIPYHIYEEN